MTRKIYKTAMGKNIDLGALLLQNEQVRAVGNMNVNSAGDVLDGTNRIIDQRNSKVQRQYNRQTNVSNLPVASSNLHARKNNKKINEELPELDTALQLDTFKQSDPVTEIGSKTPATGGLAAAMARSRDIKQELEKNITKKPISGQKINKI